jgi:hypothetical protein
MPKKYEHDLAVSLDAPAFMELGNSIVLNATVRNKGLSNETDVELYLLINGTVVSSAMIPELLVGESYTINYVWTPTSTGNYNITAYAPPVLEEENTANNIVIKRAYVFFYTRLYLPHEWVGAGNPMGWHADDASWQYTLPFDFPFYGVNYRTIYISSNGLITFLGPDISYGNSIPDLAGKLAIAPAWDDWVTYEPFDIYVWQNSTHVGIRWYVCAWGSSTIANFEAILNVNGIIQFNYAYNDGPVSATIGISNGAGHILAEEATSINYISTIVFTPFLPEHEIAVALKAPSILRAGTSTNLMATVYNRGYSNETNVELYLLINGSIVAFTIIDELPAGSDQSMIYRWSPSVAGEYNVTVYAMPVPGEEYTANNFATEMVIVFEVPTGTYIYIDPLEMKVVPGDSFTVTLKVANVVDLYTWQVRLLFDPTILECTGAWYPDDHVFSGKVTAPAEPVIDNTAGSILFGNGLVGYVPGVNVTVGSLMQVSFNAKSVGISPLSFKLTGVGRTFLLNSDGDFIDFEVLPGVVEVVSHIPPSVNDIAIIAVVPSAIEVYAGWPVNITVIVQNNGEETVTFTVSAYYNASLIGTQTVYGLSPAENATLIFVWDTSGLQPCKSYIIMAEASALPDETNIDNNILIDGSVKLKMLGDVNGDGIIDYLDINAIAIAFGSTPGRPRWKPELDLNLDSFIDMKDMYIIAKNFGKACS